MAITSDALLIEWTGSDASAAGLALTGILLDFAVQMDMVLGQRAVYALDPARRARLHALYMISIFIGGAIGSALAGPLYEAAGWPAVMLVGGRVAGHCPGRLCLQRTRAWLIDPRPRAQATSFRIPVGCSP